MTEISMWGPKWSVPKAIPLSETFIAWMNREGFAAEATDGELIRGKKPPNETYHNFFFRLYTLFLKEQGYDEMQSLHFKKKTEEVLCPN